MLPASLGLRQLPYHTGGPLVGPSQTGYPPFFVSTTQPPEDPSHIHQRGEIRRADSDGAHMSGAPKVGRGLSAIITVLPMKYSKSASRGALPNVMRLVRVRAGLNSVCSDESRELQGYLGSCSLFNSVLPRRQRSFPMKRRIMERLRIPYSSSAVAL